MTTDDDRRDAVVAAAREWLAALRAMRTVRSAELAPPEYWRLDAAQDALEAAVDEMEVGGD